MSTLFSGPEVKGQMSNKMTLSKNSPTLKVDHPSFNKVLVTKN